MDITPKHVELFLKSSEPFGFKGYKGGKFILGDTKTSSVKKALSHIAWPAVYSDDLWDELKLEQVKHPSIFERTFTQLAMEIAREVGISEFVANSDLDVTTQKIKDLVPCYNVTTYSKKILLYDPETKTPYADIDPVSYLGLLGLTLQDLIQDPNVPKVYPTYNPNMAETIFEGRCKITGSQKLYFNFYTAPIWKRGEKVVPRFDGYIKAFIRHLFPNDEEREAVLDWMHYMMTDRCQTMLCLAGMRGVGKNIFVEDILGNLAGQHNIRKVNQEILSEKFNPAFKYAQLVIFDEVEVTTNTALNKIKAFCNDTLVVEEKGQDSETIQNTASMVLMLNNVSDLRVMPQERRFSIPEITQSNLKEIWPEDRIAWFRKELADMDSGILAEFAWWLLEREPKTTSFHAIKGEYYFEISRRCMSSWEGFMVEYLASREDCSPIPFKRIKNAFESAFGKGTPFPTKAATIETFLEEYLHKAKCRIGTLEKEPDRRTVFYILPTPEYLELVASEKNQNVESTGNEENLL